MIDWQAGTMSSCTIERAQIVCNGKRVFKAWGHSFSSFMRVAYRALDWSYPRFYKMDPLCQLATLATRYLLQEQDLTHYKATEIALVMANTRATLHTDQRHLHTMADADHYHPRPAIFVYTLPNILIGELCMQYQIKGPSAFFIQPQPDWDFLLSYSQMLLTDPQLKVCLTGWIEYDNNNYAATLHLVQPFEKT